MSKIDLAKFCVNHLAKQPELKARIDALGEEQEFARALVEAGAEAGFHFDEAEVIAAMRFHSATANQLADEQLDAVAGGADKRDPAPTPPKTTYLVITLEQTLISG